MNVTMPHAQKLRLSEREAATFLGITQRTLQDWRLNRRGPAYIKLGRRIVYGRDDLQAYLDANRVEPCRQAGTGVDR